MIFFDFLTNEEADVRMNSKRIFFCFFFLFTFVSFFENARKGLLCAAASYSRISKLQGGWSTITYSRCNRIVFGRRGCVLVNVL